MYKLKSESDCVNWDNMVVEEADKKLVKEYNDFCCWNFTKVEGDHGHGGGRQAGGGGQQEAQYNDFFKFSSVRFKI